MQCAPVIYSTCWYEKRPRGFTCKQDADEELRRCICVIVPILCHICRFNHVAWGSSIETCSCPTTVDLCGLFTWALMSVDRTHVVSVSRFCGRLEEIKSRLENMKSRYDVISAWKAHLSLPGELCWRARSTRPRRLSPDQTSSHDSSATDPGRNQA